MKKISIAILVLVVALASCKKTPEVNLKYVDVERDLITVGMTTATVQCDYDYIATLKKAYFYYGEGANEADMNTAEMRVVQNTLYVDLTGLRANTTYSYFYEFHNGFNSMRTALKTFKTEASPTTVTLPTVVTATVTEITANSAKGGGEVTNDGGAQVTERGICWSTHANPTLNDHHVAAGEGTGAFTAMMNGLEANTTYHVRAYAINEVGTAYGLDWEFVTLSGGGSGAPEGAINGLFTINENGDQVYFSQGNLQYQASTNTWRFAENQWNFVGTQTFGELSEHGDGNVEGSDNNDVSEDYDGWIDLFNWGTSGYNHGANNYHPWDIGGEIWDYYPYGHNNYNLFDNNGQADWGYNAISNGGNAENQWRTLTKEEWNYVINERSVESGIRYAKANVNEVNGIILLPDGWRESVYDLNNANLPDASYVDNTISESDWVETLQYNGVVFLPAAGHRQRYNNNIDFVGTSGCYWSSTIGASTKAYYVLFYENGLNAVCDWEFWFSSSVRLVQDAH